MKLEDLNLLDFGNTIKLAGMILTGQNMTYLAYFPEPEESQAMFALDLSFDDWKILLRQMDLQETKVLMDDKGNIKKAILRKTARQIDANISWKVFRRDNYTCRYCGKNNVPLTVDHLVLWEDGGPSIEENLLTSCSKCNKKRGNTSYDKWLKSDAYKKRAKNLTEKIMAENLALVPTLDNIPRTLHQPSRGKKKGRK